MPIARKYSRLLVIQAKYEPLTARSFHDYAGKNSIEKILVEAKETAKKIKLEAEEKAKEIVKRKEEQAKEKINASQADTIKKIKQIGSRVAILASENYIKENIDDASSKRMLEQTTKEINNKL